MSSLKQSPELDNDRKVQVEIKRGEDNYHALIPERPFVTSVAILAVVGAILTYFLLA